MPTTFILADTRGHGRCRSCQAPIVWAQVARSGKKMPFNPPLVALTTKHDEAHRLLEEVDLGESHFASCPDAQQHRRPR